MPATFGGSACGTPGGDSSPCHASRTPRDRLLTCEPWKALHWQVVGRWAQYGPMKNSPDGESASRPVVGQRERQDPPWWHFIEYRRRFVSDRAWFGLAFLAAGIGNLHDGTLAWLSLAAIPLGALLLASAARRVWVRAERAAESIDRSRQTRHS